MATIDFIAESRYKFDRKKVRERLEKTLAEKGVLGDAEITVSVVGERKMKTLHKKYLKTEEATDVISFPLEDVVMPNGTLILGDIVICYPVAVRQAAEENMMVDDEVAFLAEHGCLHLLGFHHGDNGELLK